MREHRLGNGARGLLHGVEPFAVERRRLATVAWYGNGLGPALSAVLRRAALMHLQQHDAIAVLQLVDDEIERFARCLAPAVALTGGKVDAHDQLTGCRRRRRSLAAACFTTRRDDGRDK